MFNFLIFRSIDSTVILTCDSCMLFGITCTYRVYPRHAPEDD